MTFDAAMMTVLAAAIAAGLVRGFTGFGAGLILMPVAGAVLGPRVAPPAFLITDFVLTVPMAFAAVGSCR